MEIAILNRDLKLALDSVSAYVERADTLMILAPSSVHADMIDSKTGRKAYTCYRTWRRRGFCVLELFASFLSRRSTHPVLLVQTDLATPIWISPLESLKLAVGECDFTCCETNHLGHSRDIEMTCVRPKINTVLKTMVHAKSKYLFQNQSVIHGRWVRVFEHWWLRGLIQNGPPPKLSRVNSVSEFKRLLGWEDKIDGDFADREDISLLFYSVLANNLDVAERLIQQINQIEDDKERESRIESKILEKGFPYVAIPGSCTALLGAMSISSPKLVELLLKNGANPSSKTVNGNNALLCACVFNRVDNVNYWLREFPTWDVNARNTIFGGVALAAAVSLGSNRLDLTKTLLNAGATIDLRYYTGGTPLVSSCKSEDSNPDVVRMILSHTNQSSFDVNTRCHAQSLKWKAIRAITKTSVRLLSKPKNLFRHLAEEAGATALHEAGTFLSLSLRLI